MPFSAKPFGKKGIQAAIGVPVGGGFSLPPGALLAANDIPWLPYDLELTVVLEDGRYECRELRCVRKAGGEPVSPEGLRTISFRDVLVHALSWAVTWWEPNPDGAGFRGAPVGAWSDELVQVAAVYRFAYACGDQPTRAVAAALDLPYSTAGKRVMAARKAGLLDPTDKGKAGG